MATEKDLLKVLKNQIAPEEPMASFLTKSIRLGSLLPYLANLLKEKGKRDFRFKKASSLKEEYFSSLKKVFSSASSPSIVVTPHRGIPTFTEDSEMEKLKQIVGD